MQILINLSERIYGSLVHSEKIIRDIYGKDGKGGSLSLQANLAILDGKFIPENHREQINIKELRKVKDAVKVTFVDEGYFVEFIEDDREGIDENMKENEEHETDLEGKL